MDEMKCPKCNEPMEIVNWELPGTDKQDVVKLFYECDCGEDTSKCFKVVCEEQITAYEDFDDLEEWRVWDNCHYEFLAIRRELEPID